MSKLTKFLLGIMAVGLVVGFIGLSDAIKLWKGDINDIEDISVGDLKAGDMYEGEIIDAYDIIAEETTTQTYGFVPVNKSVTPYYFVELDNCYVVIDVTSEKQKEAFEKLMDQTWDYLDEKTDEKPDPVEISTTAIKMPDKVKEFLKDYCDESGMSSEDRLRRGDLVHYHTYYQEGYEPEDRQPLRNIKIAPCTAGLFCFLY